MRFLGHLAKKLLPEPLKRASRRARARTALLSALDSWGFEASRRLAQPVDCATRPLPWYTYPAIAFLDGLNFSNCDVFEWGAGNSTLYWSRNARFVRSIEHDRHWFDLLSMNGLPANVTLVHAGDAASYLDGPRGDAFDVVVVDGLHRAECARRAPLHLKPGGLIILDNSDWLPKTAGQLRNAGFIQVDFHGLGPINAYPWCTSFFFPRDFGNRPSERQPRRDPLSLDRDWDEDPTFGL
jgi:hypothetical protein